MIKKFLYTVFSCLAVLLPMTLLAQLDFVENKGQWHENVQYRTDFNTGSFFLENGGFTVMLHNPDDVKKLFEINHGHQKAPAGSFVFHSFVYQVKLAGANRQAKIVPEKPLPTYNNYFIGSDSSKWAGNCKLFQSVTYQNIYPKIDLRYYSDRGTLKYDFIVHPGGNTNNIVLEYNGPENISLDKNELLVKTPVSTVRELYPYSYQYSTEGRREVKARYVVSKNQVRFDVTQYNRNETLVIDPTIIFSSFTGSTADNWGYTATPGRDGSLYGGGIVFGAGYRTSPGAYNTTFNGGLPEDGMAGYDIGIFKFSANGTARVYATYLGGANNEQPHSMIEDAQGNLIVAGRTLSNNYPKTIPLIGSGGNFDIVITKFNSTGSAIIGSVVIGGSGKDGVNIESKTASSGSISLRRNYGDDARSEVMIDGSGSIYLASCTQSANFPVTTGTPIQATFGGGLQDGVIMKFAPDLSAPNFITFFGGSGDDACFVMAISPTNGNLYVGGATASTVLPGLGTGAIQNSFAGGAADGFVTEINPAGTSVIRTTYLSSTPTGTSSSVDIVYGLKFDKYGFPYVMGTTTGNWPVINATYSNTGSKQFIAKLKPDLSAFVYSTIFGKSDANPSLSPIAFLVDRCENVYVSGWGGNINGAYTGTNTFGLPSVRPIPNIPAADGSDFYFFVMEKNANSCLFASHFGQNGGTGDHVDGGTSRFDENGVIYQAICANCGGGANFPVTAGAVYTTNGSSNCNEACVKIEMNFAGVGSNIQSSLENMNGIVRGCFPLNVDFRDSLAQGVRYFWNFGDASPITTTTVPTTSHIYAVPGTYNVMLIAEDSSKCNIRDTSYLTVIASDKIANADFIPNKIPPCQNLGFTFTNTSTASNAAFTNQSFTWDFGDGTPVITTGTAMQTHTYAAPGTYTVTLIMKDTNFCNAPDTAIKTVRVATHIVASFTAKDSGCAPFTPDIKNTSSGGTIFSWQLTDGTVLSTDADPVITFPNAGTYQMYLIAIDSSTCNIIDTSQIQTITVIQTPIADFSWSPFPAEPNTPILFTNLSQFANSYLWNFGDGATSTLVNPVHEYNSTGTYDVTLIAYNNLGCTDTAMKKVPAIVNPLLDVPSGFTPGQPGANAVVYVRGYGIAKLDFKIYNRYGELVFHSTDKNKGWDGTYKGKQQPMEVYTYTVDAVFTDGTKGQKVGDITLLR